MELQGVITKIGNTETFGNNGFRKRELVIETDEQYKQTILIEFVQDKCDILNNYTEGQKVKIGLNLRGREWTNPHGEVKYFNSIQGWSIVNIGQNNPLPAEPFPTAPELNDEEFDDLPY